MKKAECVQQKKVYTKPEITKLDIDNQISMVMMSISPPDGPCDGCKNLQFNNSNNPYKINRG